MTVTEKTPQRAKVRKQRRDPVRDGLIVVSMTVVALALGIGLYLQFGLAFWLAVVAALSVYVALLSTHVLIRRSEHIDALRRELARLEHQKQSGPLAPSVEASSASMSMSQPARRPAAQPESAPIAAKKKLPSLDEYWKLSPGQVASVAHRAEAPHLPTPSPAMPEPDVRDDVEASQPAEPQEIDAVIKKLAADITQGQAERRRETAAVAASPVAAVAEPKPAVPTPAEQFEIDESVAALHAAADAMREAGRAFASTAAESGVAGAAVPMRPTSPPPLPQARVEDAARNRLSIVAEALERERFDVLLEPILGLKDRRATHYVVSVRLRDGLGDSIAGLGADRLVPGSGLLPLLDAVKVENAARIVWRMEDRAKPGALFSQLNGESLVSDRFLNRFADTYRQGDVLSGRLVLSFKQDELRLFSELQWSTLRDMADLGFRFCLDDITALDLDFSALATAGFTFARLDAEVFLDGLQTGDTIIPAGDICRHFTALGLAVIVAGIADEDVSAQLQHYGVELGHGSLYGAPRPVKADVLRNPHAAAVA